MRIFRLPAGFRISWLFATLAGVTGLVLFFMAPPDGAPPGMMRAAGVVVLAIGLWASSAVPEYYTTLVFFFLAMAFGIAPANVVFSGFHSGAIWMVLGGLVIGAAVQATGLGRRVAELLVGRTQGTYFRTIFGIVVISMLLAFFMPSATGRVVIILPIVLAVAERMGFRPGSNGYIAMSLAVGAGTLHPGFAILPAGVPNLGLMGAAESLHGIHLIFGEYLYRTFPVVGVVTTLAIPVILCRLFPDKADTAAVAEISDGITGAEKKLALILVAALGFWITDFWHGVAPAWIAIGASILCLAPRTGVLPTGSLVNKINLGPWFFVAGIVGMGAVVVHSGLGRSVADGLFHWVDMTPGHDALNYAIVVGLGGVMGLVTSMPGQPGIMSALAQNISHATGWPLETVLMTQVPSWLLAMFPYQLPPIVATIALARLPMAPTVRFLVCLAVFSGLVTAPLLFLWWRLIGFMGA